MATSNNSSSNNSNSKKVTYRDCWLLFGNVNDVGWTHIHNAARKEIHSYLRQNYPNVDFQSMATPSTFFLSEEERHKLLVDHYIREKQCDYIFASSNGILNGRDIEYAETFPNVSFGRMLDPPQTGPNIPPNLVDFGTDWFPSSFTAGAVAASLLELKEDGNNSTSAASTAPSCAGFINAFEHAGGAWAHVTGFALGYHWRWKQQHPNSADVPKVHVVTMNSYYQPDAEVIAARQLVEQFGCTVITKHTDPNVSGGGGGSEIFHLTSETANDNFLFAFLSSYSALIIIIILLHISVPMTANTCVIYLGRGSVHLRIEPKWWQSARCGFHFPVH